MGLNNILKFIRNHPLAGISGMQGLARFLRWQIGSRILQAPVIWPFVNDARLIVQRGMSAATGNLYVGLMEFESMGFLLHYLRPGDVFFDIGANIGAYSVLAAKAAGATCLAVEPAKDAFETLMDNIHLNRVGHLATGVNAGIGGSRGRLRFSTGLDTTNHVLGEGETGGKGIDVEIMTLDEAAGSLTPEIIKIDVEGYEWEVVAGGKKTFSQPGLNAVLMELRGHGGRYGFDERAIDAGMRSSGFIPCSYDPLRRALSREPEGRLGDMLYVRDLDKALRRVRTAPAFTVNGRRV
jgi:FkbM family methyltransferase